LLAQQVAGGAGDGADDRALVGGERVEQRGLADVRRADDHRVQAVGQAQPARGLRAQSAAAAATASSCDLQRRRAQRIDVLVGKSKPASTWMRSTVSCSDQRLDAARELAVERAARGARGRLAAGADQVGDRLGLREVEPPFEEGAFGELAGAGATRAQLEATRQQAGQQRRAAVRLLAPPRLRRCRNAAPRNHSAMPSSMRAPSASWKCTWCAWRARSVALHSDCAISRARAPGQPHDADAGGAGRGGDRGDRLAHGAARHIRPLAPGHGHRETVAVPGLSP
jgi:hypothetical protein